MKARKKKETLLLDDFFRQQIAHLDENENHFTAANYRNAGSRSAGLSVRNPAVFL